MYKKKTNNNKVPWNNELQLLKRASVDSHHNWVLNGKPRTGDVWHLKVKNHLEYKNAIKEARSQSKKIFIDELLYKLMAKNTSNFWSAWRSKVSKTKSGSPSIKANDFVEKF